MTEQPQSNQNENLIAVEKTLVNLNLRRPLNTSIQTFIGYQLNDYALKMIVI